MASQSPPHDRDRGQGHVASDLDRENDAGTFAGTPRPGDVTRLLLDWGDGDPEAHEKLMAAVYDELRKLAASYLRREREQDMQATTLVHDAYLRLIQQKEVQWQNRAHFFGIAAQQMRRILVDRAREHLAKKRGSGARKLSLDEALTLSEERSPELVALDDALDALAREDEQLARVVEQSYFAGMTHEEVAEVEGISVPTVTRKLRLAKAWLFRELDRSQDGSSA